MDKKIINQLCNGIFSYVDLAKTLDVTRGTIYRRIAKLERDQVIEKKIMAIPNYHKLELSAIFIGLNVDYDTVEDLLKLLQDIPRVKGLWRTYGEYQIVIEVICERGCEGSAISDFHKAVARSSERVNEIAIGFDWRKIDLSPY